MKKLNIINFINMEKLNMDDNDTIINETSLFSIEHFELDHSYRDYKKLVYENNTLTLIYNLYEYVVEAIYRNNHLVEIKCSNKYNDYTIIYKTYTYTGIINMIVTKNDRIHNSLGPAKRSYKLLFNLFMFELKNEQSFYVHGHQISAKLFTQKMDAIYNLNKSDVLALDDVNYIIYTNVIKDRFPEKLEELKQIDEMRRLMKQ